MASINSESDSVVREGIIPLSIEFNEPVQDFDTSSLTITNATATVINISDSIIFTTTLTPDQPGEVVIEILEGAVSDRVGHRNKTGFRKVFYYVLDSTVTSITEDEQTDQVRVYPIPTTGEVTVVLDWPNSSLVAITLTTLGGKVVYQKSYHKTQVTHDTIDMTLLPPGVYVATFTNQKEKPIFRKIIKQ